MREVEDLGAPSVRGEIFDGTLSGRTRQVVVMWYYRRKLL